MRKNLFIFISIFIASTSVLAINLKKVSLETSVLTPAIEALFANLGAGETLPVWIFFCDRAMSPEELSMALEKARRELPPRTLQRRIKGGTPELDEKDLPVPLPYIAEVSATGAHIRTVTRYFNGTSADVSYQQAQQIVALPFVKSLQPVARFWRNEPWVKTQGSKRVMDYNYGDSYTQLQLINVPAMHNLGFTGEGVLVCLLDTGYNLEHIAFQWMDILATWDFINDDSVVTNQPGDPPSQDDHGTFTLSTCGGLVDGELYGPAFEATFMAGKTEITEDEIPIEEDYYVEGLEWADSLGADVVSTSLGYFDWYTFEDLDGNTCVTTIGVDIAVSHGIVCCTAAGNERNSPWGHIIAPADADSVIAVGAVEEDSSLASFSSPGPTYDGRIKPEVCAMGVLVYCADPGDIYGFTYASGTSLSTPLVGGAAALIVQAHPNWSPLMVREALMMTASQNYHPDNDFGWGIVDVLAAAQYSVTPEILTRTPENDTVQVYRDSSITFTVSAIDEDGDPLTYIFMIDDSVYAQSDSGIFTFSSSIIDTFTLTAIVQDLIQFADSTSWTIFVTEPPSLVDNGANQPATFSLSIYPNPFNPETKINFNLPSAMQVQIVVYDITGREVAILINEEMPAGFHSVDWKPEGLAEGVYFVRLKTEGFTTVRKCLLLK